MLHALFYRNLRPFIEPSFRSIYLVHGVREFHHVLNYALMPGMEYDVVVYYIK